MKYFYSDNEGKLKYFNDGEPHEGVSSHEFRGYLDHPEEGVYEETWRVDANGKIVRDPATYEEIRYAEMVDGLSKADAKIIIKFFEENAVFHYLLEDKDLEHSLVIK